MTEADIIRIKRYSEKATPGPWVADINIYGTGKHVCSRDNRVIASVNERLAGLTSGEAMDNAILMAHARTDLPACIAEIERLKKELRRYEFDEKEHTRKPKTFQAEIDAAHPAISDSADDEIYHQAIQLVSERHAKYDLVKLVNWLLVDLKAARQQIADTIRFYDTHRAD